MYKNKMKASNNIFADTLNNKLQNKSSIELSHNYSTRPPIYSQTAAIQGYTDYDN